MVDFRSQYYVMIAHFNKEKSMFARLSSFANPIKNLVSWGVGKVHSYLHENGWRIAEKFRTHTDGVHLFNFAAFRVMNIQDSKLSAKEFEALTRALMSLPNANARFYFHYYTAITGSTPALSANTKEGKALVRDCFMAVMKMYSQEFDIKNEVQYFVKDFKNKWVSDTRKAIEKHFLARFSKAVFGVEIDEKYSALRDHMFCAIHDERRMFAFGLLPKAILQIVPGIRNDMKDFDNEIKKFLVDQCNAIQKNPDNYSSDSNWIMRCAVNKFKKSIEKLSPAEIQQLSVDKDVRVGFLIIFAVENIAKVLHELLENVSTNQKLRYMLSDESETIASEISKERPLRHAVVLEALRRGLGSSAVNRYTDREIKVACGKESITIPARTFVSLSCSVMAKHGEEYPSNTFSPERFLDEKGNLNKLSKFGGFFLPFADGERQCPAQGYAIHILERYLLELINIVKRVRFQGIDFVDDEKEVGLKLGKNFT